jgi:hypothetical protein
MQEQMLLGIAACSIVVRGWTRYSFDRHLVFRLKPEATRVVMWLPPFRQKRAGGFHLPAKAGSYIHTRDQGEQ